MAHAVILGSGAQARMTYWCVLEAWPGTVPVFADDITADRERVLGGRAVPIVGDWDFSAYGIGEAGGLPFVLGVGHPENKRRLAEKAQAAGLRPAPPLVHPQAYVQGQDCRFGAGVVVFPQCVVMAGTEIEACATLIANATLGPDCRVGAYTTAYPGTVLAGGNRLGAGCLLETGVVVNEGVHLADGVHVGAQSCIIKSVEEPGARLAGVPARFLR